MANEEQLALLKEGGPQWNHWREENLRAKVDLTGAALRGALLSGANLGEGMPCRSGPHTRTSVGPLFTFASRSYSPANFGFANLSGAYAINANFGDANLSGADLSGANCLGAYLGGEAAYEVRH